MWRVMIVGVLVAAVGSGTGCAAIMTGTTQAVTVKSEPAGAKVEMDGKPVGQTPAVVTVVRGRSRVLKITKEGYEPLTVTLGTKFNGWILGNAVFGGILGIIIDLGSGAFLWVDPEAVDVVLTPLAQQ